MESGRRPAETVTERPVASPTRPSRQHPTRGITVGHAPSPGWHTGAMSDVVRPDDEPPPPRDETTAGHAAVVAVILAAGGGRRYGGPTHKLLAELPATQRRPLETVASRAIAAARQASIGPVVVVTGALDGERLGLDAARRIDDRRDHADGDRSDDEPIVVHNPRWADGQMTSVRTGIDAARRIGADRIVVGLADQPGIEPDAWRRVAATVAAIAVATYDGRRGNPVALRSDIWPLLPVDGDEGARSIMRLRPELVVEVACSGSSHDIDTTEDLRRWQNNSSTNSP